MTTLRLRSYTCLLGLTLFLAAAGAAQAAAVVGQPAPDFSAVDVNGKTVKLSDYNGKQVVLEWVNPGCPFVQKHYDSGNMQGTQRDAASKQVVWLAINSTDKGHSDYRSPAEMAKWMQGHKAAATDTLMDADGTVGKAYGARTTPHMYIVDPAGKLVYAGGIDSKATANPADIASATNYVKVALAETTAGKPISTATSRPYGCSVKYGSS
ncbi:MAG: thioredoxin family protein [Rubrivivax sp.]